MVEAQGQADCRGPQAFDAIVALGANLPIGEMAPELAVVQAMDMLDPAGVAGRSRLYRTPAFPAGAGPDFVNAAMRLAWRDTPEALLERLHAIEAHFGRTRKERWEARRMDLDLIAFGDAVLPDRDTQVEWAGMMAGDVMQKAPDCLVVPHPRMSERAFVLVPMADVHPDWRHPVTGLTVRQMLDRRPATERQAVVALA